MYLCSSTVSQILSKNYFGKQVLKLLVMCDYFRETKIRFLASILKQNIFDRCFCWYIVVLDA